MIVIDASAVVELLLATETGVHVRRRMWRSGETWHAPHLLDVEVAQALRRLERMRALDGTRGAEALQALGDLDVMRHPHDVLLPRVWALRANVTAYDAVYLALAEALAAPLVTSDGRLVSAPGHRARVEVVVP